MNNPFFLIKTTTSMKLLIQAAAAQKAVPGILSIDEKALGNLLWTLLLLDERARQFVFRNIEFHLLVSRAAASHVEWIHVMFGVLFLFSPHLSISLEGLKYSPE